jgi:hypothetical protein
VPSCFSRFLLENVRKKSTNINKTLKKGLSNKKKDQKNLIQNYWRFYKTTSAHFICGSVY